MTEEADRLRDEIADLRAQVAGIADFVTAVSAAMIADRSLPAKVVRVLLDEGGPLSPDGASPRAALGIDAATIARNVLAIAGCIPMPRHLQLVHDADAPPKGG